MCIFTVSTGTDMPTPILLNRHVRKDIAARWRDLGFELLDKHPSMLNNIAIDEHNVQDCCTKLFVHWLRVDTDASWDKLIKALDNIEENRLAMKIKREVLKGIIVTKYVLIAMSILLQ